MPTLFLVGTPIGNLEDISLRAIQILKSVSLIAAEDTRTAKQLLAHFDIHTPVTSYYELRKRLGPMERSEGRDHKPAKLDRILGALEAGDVAVISEAGMPGLSDPGYELVRAAIARNIRVSPVPGPTAVLAALVGSGLPAGSFYYLGFLPREPRSRRKLLQAIREETTTLVAYEAPHRLRESLEDMERILGPREVCVARELTKLFEEFRRGPIPEVRQYFDKVEPRGEFTLVIQGVSREGHGARAREAVWSDERVKRRVRALIGRGVPRTEAVKRTAREGRRERREVYELTLEESR
jgi:16S rRNA (cytidine1402-2'-O)-methyltransferase